ncbi:MAG: flagellar hook-associated protein FlgK [Sphingomonadaceae bacterium]|nr:flagellar hook-associated protein FlgK [Sphingomonadaceae bacterium]
MASDLLSIGASGARAARSALDVAAHNIANAATGGYVRRGIRLEEVSAGGGAGRVGDISLAGVRATGITRSVDAFRAAEARRTSSDSARAQAEVDGLRNVESALEQSGMFDAVVEFEASLQRLESDPVDPSLRAAALAGAERLAGTFNIAAGSLQAASDNLRFEAQGGVAEVNLFASELARINVRLTRVGPDTSEQASLFDQRDRLLGELAERADITAQIDPLGLATVRIGGAGGDVLVANDVASAVAMNTAGDGTISFTLGGSALALNGGSLAGKALALQEAANASTRLDALADDIASAVNAVQAGGVALDGSPGQPLFAGSGAAGISVALLSGDELATVPGGAVAGSRDGSNLAVMRAALANGVSGGGAASRANSLIFDISATVSAREITAEALETIADSAHLALVEFTGVDLEEEAAALVRYQQAFQASGRVMQVASEIFDTIIGIG